MYNSPVCIVGNVCSELDLIKGLDKLNLRIASSRRYRNAGGEWVDTDTLYLDVEAWGQLAVNAHISLKKGMPVIVQGTIYTDSWETPEGEKKQRIKMRATAIGLDLNKLIVGSKESRKPAEHVPDGVTMPPGRDKSSLDDDGAPPSGDGELVGATSAGGDEVPF